MVGNVLNQETLLQRPSKTSYRLPCKQIPTQRRVLVSLLLALNIFHNIFCVSFVDFEQVNVSWDRV